MGPAPRRDASIGDLLGSLAQDSKTLVRQELRLVSFEAMDRARSASGEIGVIAIGGGFALAGLLFLMGAVLFGLATVMPIWLAALILGAVASAVGYLFIHQGLRALRPAAMQPDNPPERGAASTPQTNSREIRS
jgi:hypothetical protein